MGQEISNQGIIEKSSGQVQLKKIKTQLQNSKLNYQGILKIAKTPFQNCEKIEVETEVFFMEKTRMSLKQLIKNKSRLKKYFSEQEVTKMIQNLVYTLAYLQNAKSPYPDMSPSNIFLSGGIFKILPPSVLKYEIFTKLKLIIKQRTGQYIPASPEMIIAIRCQEQEIREKQILFKSNVFALGLTLLEVCTLKPSSQCYDLQTYDILDQVITSRIEEIQLNYSNKIARIVANMLDYDFDERMTPLELSVWVNRQLNEPIQLKKSPSFPKNKTQQENIMVKSRLVQQQIDKKEIEITTRAGKAEKRIDQIRSKIMKQKMRAQLQMTEQKQQTKSRAKYFKNNKKQNAGLDRDRSKKKNLPNPYLKQQFINRSTDRIESNRRSASPTGNNGYNQQPRDLGIHDVNKLRYQQPKNSNIRFSYEDQTEPKSPNNHINLKYKYNLDEDTESIQMSSNRKKDGERFVRIEKQLSNYQRALSGRKYDYNVGQHYQQKATAYGVEDGDNMQKSPRYRKRLNQQNTNISDFSFEPTQQRTDGLRRSYSIKQMKKQVQGKTPLSHIQNQRDENKAVKILKMDQDYRQPVQNMALQRHQQLFGNQNKHTYTYLNTNTSININTRGNHKQNEDVLVIKREIERSRRIIEEVKKTQEQYGNISD